MALDLLRDEGVPIDQQRFTWRELVQEPTSKLDDDAFTRVRVILMNGLMAESLRFQHVCARMNRQLQPALARVRRVAQHQQTMVNWLLPADLSPLETTIAFEQAAIEITAAIAMKEPDPYMAQVHRFGLLEDFDHLYRFTALMDRVEGKDANNILQSYTDIRPGRPTAVEHRHPDDDLRDPYDRVAAAPLTKLHALTLVGAEYQTHDYYMTIGPMFSDPIARMLYAEIASIEEQHVTQYESICDPSETWLEKWLLHEATEAYNYHSCMEQESNHRVKAIWERFVEYELGQLQFVMRLFEQHERRDPAEVLPETMPEPLPHASQRDFVRQVCAAEANLRASGARFIPASEETSDSKSIRYRRHMNAQGSPSEIAAAGYRWMPGTELVEQFPETGRDGRGHKQATRHSP